MLVRCFSRWLKRIILLIGQCSSFESGRRAQGPRQKINLDRKSEIIWDKLAKLYDDKLSGEFILASTTTLRDRYETDLSNVTAKLSAMDRARADFYDKGERLLELASNAHFKFKKALPEERRELHF